VISGLIKINLENKIRDTVKTELPQ
jgi:hypothetical protein